MLLLLLPQDSADAVNVSGHYRKGHIAPESVDSMVRAQVQPMHLKRVDRRFNRRVRTPVTSHTVGGSGLGLILL